MKALVIVAHPDDETIWMGSQFKKKNNWTIFSLCRSSDPDRAPKFKKVCEYYKAKSIMTDLEDDKLEPVDSYEIIKLILANLDENKFDVIYTHGENGEYGHIRHKEIHKAVKKMVITGMLIGKLIFFDYHNVDGNCKAIKNKNYYALTDKEVKEKKMVITKMYGFDVGSFEAKTCGDESFK